MMAIHAITDMGIRAAVTAVDRNMAVITALTRAATVDTRSVGRGGRGHRGGSHERY